MTQQAQILMAAFWGAVAGVFIGVALIVLAFWMYP